MVDTAEFERDLLARIVQNIKPSKAAVFSGQNYQMSMSHGVETDQNELNVELVEKVVQTEGPVSDKVHKRQLAVPYKNAEGKVLGVMYVEIAAPRRLKFRDLAILQGLGRQMVERHWQQPSSDSETAPDPEMMSEVTRYVRSTLSIVSSVLKPQRVLILVRLEEGPKIVASRGFDDVQKLAEVPFSRELVDSVWEKGETCHIRDAMNDPQYSQFEGVKEHSLRSVCICPLNKLDGEDRGLIYLDSCKDPAEFLTAEVSILQRLALALEKDLARVLAPDPEGGTGDVLSSSGSSILDSDHEYSLPDATPYLDEPDSFIVSDEDEPEAEEAEIPSQPEEVSDEYRPTELFSGNEEGDAEQAEDDLAVLDPPDGSTTEVTELDTEAETGELSYEDEIESEPETADSADELSDSEPEAENDEQVAEPFADEEIDSSEEQESEPETADFEEDEDTDPEVQAEDTDTEEGVEPEPASDTDVEEVEEPEVEADIEEGEEAQPDADAEEGDESEPDAALEKGEDTEPEADLVEDEEPEPDAEVEVVEELESDVDAGDVEGTEPDADYGEDEEPETGAEVEEPEQADDTAEPQSRDEVAEALAEIEAAESFEGELEEMDEEFPDTDHSERTFEEREIVDHEPDENEEDPEPTTEQDGGSSPPPLLDLYDGSPLSGGAEFQYEPSENDVVTITLPPQLLDGDEDEDESDEIEPTVEETAPVLNQETDREVESVRSLPVDATVEVSAEIAARALAGVRALQEQQEAAEEEPEVGEGESEEVSEDTVDHAEAVDNKDEASEPESESVDFDDAEDSAAETEAEEANKNPEESTNEDESEEIDDSKDDGDEELEDEDESSDEPDSPEDDEETDDSGDDEAEELDAEQASSEESAEDVEETDDLEDDDAEEEHEVDSEQSTEDVEESDESDDDEDEESEEEAEEREEEEEEDDSDDNEEEDSEEDDELEEADEPPPKVEPAAQPEPVAARESTPPPEVAQQEESLMKYVERGLQAVTPAKNASFWERLKWVFSPESVPQGGNYSHIHISGKVVLQDNDWKGSEPIEVTLSFPSHKMTVVLELAKGESDYAYHGRFEGESPVWFEVTVEKPGYFPIRLSKVTFRAGEVDSDGEPTTRVHEITLIPRKS